MTSRNGTAQRFSVKDVVRVKDKTRSERRGQEAVIEKIDNRSRGIGLKLRFADGWWGYYETHEVERV